MLKKSRGTCYIWSLATTMEQMSRLLIVSFIFFVTACNKGKTVKEQEFITLAERLEKISDSTRIGGITIKNLFKSQILAHKENEFDSLMIVEKVYEPHQALWDNCYAMIFGEENASKFNTETGMVAWNRELYPKNKDFFDQRAEKLLEINIDSILKDNLTKFDKLVPYKVESTISILFTPITGILFGGCTNDQFCIELNYEEQDIVYTIEKGIPHELNHLAYDPLRDDDPKRNTALRQTIDEGFACYFSWIFFDKEIPKYQAVENMTEQDWSWYKENEKEIFLKTKEYFDDESGNNPLLRNDQIQLFKDAPKTLNYWLGFRIIEKYVEKYGAESWNDIYKLNVQEVLDKSEYEQYINRLE